METIVLTLEPAFHLTDDGFCTLCLQNRDLKLELSAAGELIIMSPVGGESGIQEADLIIELGNWNRQTGLGFVFSSSTLFRLPNGAFRSPNAVWVSRERWESLTPEQRRRFPPLTPDFVIELRSATDRLQPLQHKMQEYLASGPRLGWLIDPENQQVEIYRSGHPTERLDMPVTLDGEEVLPGFGLDLG